MKLRAIEKGPTEEPPAGRWARVEWWAKRVTAVGVLLGALLAVGHYGIGAVRAASNLATKDDVQAAVAAHVTASPEITAAAPVVKSILETLISHGDRLTAVETSERISAKQLDWLVDQVLEQARQRHPDVKPPPRHFAKP